MFAPVLLVAMGAALLGAPFEDTQGRFTIDLPRGWSFAPQPGDVSGAAFQRQLNDIPASFSIKILEVGKGTTGEDFANRLSAGISSEPGYELKSQGQQQLAGVTVYRRHYVVGISGAKFTKMVEDHLGVRLGKGYIVHMETLEDNFKKLAPDFAHLLSSLRFTGVDAGAPSPFPAELVGKWLMVGTKETIFQLNADGTFDLAGNPGVWRINGSEMLTRPLGGGAEIFQWRLVDGELEVNNDNLGSALRYRRTNMASPAPAPAAAPKTLVGKWKGKGYTLEIKDGGKVVLNRKSGTYKEADGLLVMRLGKKKKRMVVSFVLNGDELTLSEDKFGKGVVFKRK